MVQKGTVLGVGFDSVSSTWHFSDLKADKVVRRCLDGANAKHLSLLQIQKIMGSVNDLAQMCPLLKSHQKSGNEFMAKFGGDNDLLRAVPIQLRRDLEVVAKVAESAKSGLPIAEIISQPGLAALTFYMDAAGASFTVVGGKRCYHDNDQRGSLYWRHKSGGYLGLDQIVMARRAAHQAERREGALLWYTLV